MKAIHTLTLVAAALWLAVLVLGFAGLDGVRSQNVPGFPSAEQFRYYIYIPAGVLALVAIAWALARRSRLLAGPALVVAVLALLGLPWYLLYYTGGV